MKWRLLFSLGAYVKRADFVEEILLRASINVVESIMIIFIFITIRLLHTNGNIYTVMNIEYDNKL